MGMIAISLRRMRNPGKFESETVELWVDLSSGGDEEAAYEELETKALDLLYPERQRDRSLSNGFSRL